MCKFLCLEIFKLWWNPFHSWRHALWDRGREKERKRRERHLFLSFFFSFFVGEVLSAVCPPNPIYKKAWEEERTKVQKGFPSPRKRRRGEIWHNDGVGVKGKTLGGGGECFLFCIFLLLFPLNSRYGKWRQSIRTQPPSGPKLQPRKKNFFCGDVATAPFFTPAWNAASSDIRFLLFFLFFAQIVRTMNVNDRGRPRESGSGSGSKRYEWDSSVPACSSCSLFIH